MPNTAAHIVSCKAVGCNNIIFVHKFGGNNVVIVSIRVIRRTIHCKIPMRFVFVSVKFIFVIAGVFVLCASLSRANELAQNGNEIANVHFGCMCGACVVVRSRCILIIIRHQVNIMAPDLNSVRWRTSVSVC